MRVAINAATAVEDRSGIGTYTRNLIRSIAEVDARNEYRLYYGYLRGREVPRLPGPNFENVRSRLPGRLRRVLFERCGLPIELLLGRIDVLHEPYIYVPPTRAAHCVITLFDAIPLRFPHAFSDVLRAGWTRRVRSAVQRADCVITASEASRCDLEDLLNVPAERIRVIPLAADPIFHPLDPSEARVAVGKRYDLWGQIILHMGRLDPHKNVDRLVEAFAQALPRLSAQAQLVLTALTEGRHYYRVAEQVATLKLKEHVRFLGHLRSERLVELINAAAVVVMPSLWEGFGLPVLEAMACGTPVITSNAGATREIGDGAAVLIDPEDTSMLSHAIEELATGTDVADLFRQRGLERARQYSWAQTAKETVKVYVDLATRGSTC